MKNTIALLERVRATVPRQSKGGVAKKLGIDRANLGAMYKGRRYPNPLQVAQIAKVLNLEAIEVAALIQMDKARSEESKEEARRLSPRLSTAASITLAIVVVGNYFAGETGKKLNNQGVTAYTLCEQIIDSPMGCL